MNGEKRFFNWTALLVMFFVASLVAVPAFAGEHHEEGHHAKHKAHWGYVGEHGPAHWGEMSKKFKACGEGKMQSPIDIKGAHGTSRNKLEMHYGDTKINIENNGHSIEVVYDKGSYIKVNGKRYDLAQFHFHGPSEHTVNGKHSAMEMHLVHKSKDGGYAVVGVLIEKGAKNKAFSGMWKNLPEEAGEEKELSATVNVKDLLPRNKSFYNYTGSFTTPPCTEEVKWFVMKNKVHLSGHQLKEFAEIMHGDNRPVQPLNGRVITTSGL